MSFPISRREFLVSLAAGALGSPLTGLAAGLDRALVRADLFGDKVIEAPALREYTAIYLARHPEERDHEVLVRLLFDSGYGRDTAIAKARLLEDIRADFTSGRTENVDGWVLSVTELRLWSLYLLTLP